MADRCVTYRLKESSKVSFLLLSSHLSFFLLSSPRIVRRRIESVTYILRVVPKSEFLRASLIKAQKNWTNNQSIETVEELLHLSMEGKGSYPLE